MRTLEKNWDRNVVQAEEVARGAGFQELRDAILARAGAQRGDPVVDVGTGTGLLSLPLREARRVFVPGNRFVFGDMMFRPALTTARDCQLVSAKDRALLSKGPGGVVRLTRNGLQLATERWEKPARPDWWRHALHEAGFDEVQVETLPHEGGIAMVRRPA